MGRITENPTLGITGNPKATQGDVPGGPLSSRGGPGGESQVFLPSHFGEMSRIPEAWEGPVPSLYGLTQPLCDPTRVASLLQASVTNRVGPGQPSFIYMLPFSKKKHVCLLRGLTPVIQSTPQRSLWGLSSHLTPISLQNCN